MNGCSPNLKCEIQSWFLDSHLRPCWLRSRIMTFPSRRAPVGWFCLAVRDWVECSLCNTYTVEGFCRVGRWKEAFFFFFFFQMWVEDHTEARSCERKKEKKTKTLEFLSFCRQSRAIPAPTGESPLHLPWRSTLGFDFSFLLKYIRTTLVDSRDALKSAGSLTVKGQTQSHRYFQWPPPLTVCGLWTCCHVKHERQQLQRPLKLLLFGWDAIKEAARGRSGLDARAIWPHANSSHIYYINHRLGKKKKIFIHQNKEINKIKFPVGIGPIYSACSWFVSSYFVSS